MLSAKQEGYGMAINLSIGDHKAMNEYLDSVLDAYKAGEIGLSKARADLAHAISAAAMDNEGFKQYIRLSRSDRWKFPDA